MRSDLVGRLRTLAVLMVAAIGMAADRAGAQIPYTVFDEDTEVRSLRFEFTTSKTFDEGQLKEQLALSGRGAFYGIRSALAVLPVVSPPAPHPFAPLDLQRDVARLRRFYADQGFLETRIWYEVEYNDDNNTVDVVLFIEEGRPILIRSITITEPDGGDLMAYLPEDYFGEWQRRRDAISADTGGRYTEVTRGWHETDLLAWWRNRGWAFATVEPSATIDTAAATAELTFTVDPGARTRIGTITIEGHESVSDQVIRRVLPFREGSWFNAQALAEGRQRVFGLDLFRLALVDVERGSTPDSLADITIRVTENPPRLLTGEIGYVGDGGISTQGVFAHRNFGGGARTLRVSALAETGWLNVGEQENREYRLSVAYRVPWFMHRRYSLTVEPFGYYRDNITDRSWQVGLETSLTYELGPYRFITLQHRYSHRRILDFRLGGGSTLDLETLLQLLGDGAIDSLGRGIERSTLSLSGTIGRFDPTRPARTAQARPTIEITTPAGLNTIEYFAADMPIFAYLPLGPRVVATGRARVGRVWPYGKTTRGDEVSSLVASLQLRDVLLTAGGTGSVRGWGEGQLGPKFVNLTLTPIEGTDSLELGARGYAPSGGLARISGSVELQLPFPGLGETWGTHVFLDAGRVWTPDARFRADDPYDSERWFFGTGAGIQVRTLVGPVRISVGYKLNPSELDLRDAEPVLDALLEGRPISSVPINSRRRYHIHFSLGQSF
ncbi:MAG: BamA/OMP85 family outer membrane protein [Gemmatimonadales bacterium]